MNSLCVVFDIDDTLYLERDYVFSGFAALGPWVRTWLGIPDFAERCRHAHEEGTRGSIFNRVLQDCGVPPCSELIAALVALYRAHIPDIGFCPDALDAITEAAQRWPIAVITDGPAISQSRKADALELHRFASPILLTELHGRECSKPSPVAFRKLEQTIPAGNFVYVADNPAKDFTAPRLLGWHSVRIRRPKGLHFAVEAAHDKPDAELPDCAGLVRVLLSLI
jgi:putative hydrolase of the HAD superfamily